MSGYIYTMNMSMSIQLNTLPVYDDALPYIHIYIYIYIYKQK